MKHTLIAESRLCFWQVGGAAGGVEGGLNGGSTTEGAERQKAQEEEILLDPSKNTVEFLNIVLRRLPGFVATNNGGLTDLWGALPSNYGRNDDHYGKRNRSDVNYDRTGCRELYGYYDAGYKDGKVDGTKMTAFRDAIHSSDIWGRGSCSLTEDPATGIITMRSAMPDEAGIICTHYIAFLPSGSAAKQDSVIKAYNAVSHYQYHRASTPEVNSDFGQLAITAENARSILLNPEEMRRLDYNWYSKGSKSNEIFLNLVRTVLSDRAFVMKMILANSERCRFVVQKNSKSYELTDGELMDLYRNARGIYLKKFVLDELSPAGADFVRERLQADALFLRRYSSASKGPLPEIDEYFTILDGRGPVVCTALDPETIHAVWGNVSKIEDAKLAEAMKTNLIVAVSRTILTGLDQAKDAKDPDTLPAATQAALALLIGWKKESLQGILRGPYIRDRWEKVGDWTPTLMDEITKRTGQIDSRGVREKVYEVLGQIRF